MWRLLTRVPHEASKFGFEPLDAPERWMALAK